MKPFLFVLLTCAALALLAGCEAPFTTASASAEQSDSPLTILAGPELKDVERSLKADIRNATGLALDFAYAGTLDGLDRLNAGDRFDAFWVSQNQYLAVNPAVKSRILAQEKTMLSPVVLGLKASKAHVLGWDTQDPTWKEIAEAAKGRQFTFGMTNPTSSNTGLSAVIGVAAAFAKRPDELTQADLTNPALADFFQAQALTSGSSSWLAEAYGHDQSKVDGIIDYESLLLSLNASGKLSEPLTLIYPKEGIITADYPLMLLNNARRSDYDKLVTYIRSKDFQTKMSGATLRRPVNPDATMAAAIPRRTLVELPFPGRSAMITTLLDWFLSDVRVPASSRYVLDLSGSMDGDRLESLKQAMLMLASDTTTGARRYARFQNREDVGIITFSNNPSPTALIPMGSTPEENAKARAHADDLINPLQAGGGTAIYSSVQQALTELSRQREHATEKRYYTVVLMTDGENNHGLTHEDFDNWYKQEGDTVRGIPVFPILFGEGNAHELRELADLTGGRLFDSRSTPLPVVFKEIRGYQ